MFCMHKCLYAGYQLVHANVHSDLVLCIVNKAAGVLPYLLCSGNQLLNYSRTGLKVVTSETFASDSLSIEVMFASGKVSG